MSSQSSPRARARSNRFSGLADLESYGAVVLANPDFVQRLASGGPLNTADLSVYFGIGPDGQASGYTDFTTLGAARR